MPTHSPELDIDALLPLVVDTMQTALTVLDPNGNVLFYNDYAAQILDRKPEYLGTDVRNYHNPASNKKVDKIMAGYRDGATEPMSWQLGRDGQVFDVKVAPLVIDGKFVALVHSATLVG